MMVDITDEGPSWSYGSVSLDIFYLPIKQTQLIRHKINKLVKSSPNYNLLQQWSKNKDKRTNNDLRYITHILMIEQYELH
jgi:hypothetical protein